MENNSNNLHQTNVGDAVKTKTLVEKNDQVKGKRLLSLIIKLYEKMGWVGEVMYNQ